MSILNQMFGVASSVAYIRCGGSGNNTRNVLAALAKGFGGATGDGAYVHDLFASNTGAVPQSGFDTSSLYYNDLEQKVPLLTSLYQVGAGTIIYSYANFPNIDQKQVVAIINGFSQSLHGFLPSIAYSPFTVSGLDYTMTQFNLSGINAQISGSPSSNITKAINYNWYDSTPLFVNPDFNSLAQVIKDAECQYYYLSGELLYDALPTGLRPCISYNTTVTTETGDITITVLQNTPCVDETTYIGPTSGTKFFREFADGPGSSGYFDTATLAQYVKFDEAVLDPRDYSSNNLIVYANEIDASGNYIFLISGVQADIPGFYQSGREYGIGHTNYISEGCTNHPAWPLMRMHQGDNQPKWYFSSFLGVPPDNTCYYSSGLNDWTGWKVAVFELNSSLAKNYSKLKMNPRMDTGRILKRALNLNNYKDMDGNAISPYANAIDTGDGLLTCGDYGNFGGSFYVGPPQLNGQSALPGFVFYQTFDNTTFPNGGEKAMIVMRPVITVNDTDFTVSSFNAFSGIDPVNHPAIGNNKARIPINTVIYSSGMSGMDDIFRKCFAIGDNFNNQASVTQNQEANAGYLYTGYTYTISGQQVTAGALLSGAQTIGSQYSIIKYPEGYVSGDTNFLVGEQFGFIITGDTSSGVTAEGPIIYYSYYNDGVLGAANTGWVGQFAPVPLTVSQTPWLFSPVYASQAVENYLPRYSNGPYLTFETKFLYPNAQTAGLEYNANVKGFPTGIRYSISIKEETVREAYCLSGLNGQIKNRYIVRSDANNLPHTLETLMATPFVPNDSAYSYKYDYLRDNTLYPTTGGFFYNASLPSGMVNANYVPSTSGCPQGNLNSTIYFQDNYLFNQGVKVTGLVKNRTLYTGTAGKTAGFAYTESNGGGFYWGYTGSILSGEMLYCPPLFSLRTYSLNPSAALITAMISNVFGNTNPACSNNGAVLNASLFDQNFQYNGKDPIFYEYVGGRSGVGAVAEGGYHSQGIIGDMWYNVNLNKWGNSNAFCVDSTYNYRYPPNDSYINLFALSSTGLNLYSRALSFYPYYLNWTYQPFLTPSLSLSGITTTPQQIRNNDYYFSFDLKNTFFPLQSGQTGILNSGLYLDTGLTLGPFDRDVELCVMSGNVLIPNGSLIVDGIEITDPQWGGGCYDPVTDIYPNSGIILGQQARVGKLTTFKLVPSGGMVNINVSGTGFIGFSGKSIVTIRPRTCWGCVNNQADPSTLSGDAGYLDGMRYITNGSENIFKFQNSSPFENLVGRIYDVTTTPRTEVIFPMPDPTDFDSVVKPTYDTFGNKIYKANPTLLYWTKKNPAAFFTGIRETTRLHISIDSIEVLRGNFPYKTFKTIIPSGQCIISGEFAYTGEAESAVISDGIILSGLSGAKSLSGIFQPIYVSDVLQRLPTGICNLPSGGPPYSPILPAPSYMKTRLNTFQITGNDAYIPISPSTGIHYNAFWWPAWSDLALLNPEVVYEELPPDDGNVFPESYLTFSASQGQSIATGTNPAENVTYVVNAQFATIDSTATNAFYNTGKCVISGDAIKIILNSGDLSGILTSQGNSLTMALNLNNFKQ